MASVIQSNIGPLHEKISVTISTTDYLPGFEKKLKSYAKDANIPGFRKGMVPIGMVKKMSGAAIFNDEILRSAGAEIEKYLSENKIKFFGRPMPIDNGTQYRFDMNAPQDYTFDFEIGLQTDFDIPALQGKQIEALKVIVTDAMVDEEVEKLRYRAGKMSDIEVIAHEDDVLNVSFLANGASEDAEAKKTNSLLVKYFSADTQAKLMGKAVNDTIEIILGTSFTAEVLPAILKDLGLEPTDESAKGLYYNMTIDKIGHVEKAAVEIGLFEDIYKGAGITTEEEFRARLSKEIEGYWDQQGRNKLHNDMFEVLVHETPIEVPEAFMKRWISEGGEKFVPMEQVEKEWSSFNHTMRWELICSKIASDNSISVTRDEVAQGIKNSVMQYFAQMGMVGEMDMEAEWMQGIVDKQMKDKKATDEVFNQLMTDKLFTFLETKFAIQMKDVSLEEFIKSPSKHHHHH
jgi:trigger factor